MTSDRKLFVASVSYHTTDTNFYKFFNQIGEIEECKLMRDPMTGKCRGFGFITFVYAEDSKRAREEVLELDNRRLDVKIAMPRGTHSQGMVHDKFDRTKNVKRFEVPQAPPGTKKLYVAGLDYLTTDESFTNFFLQFGELENAEVIREHNSSRSRGFGFVTYVDHNSVATVLSQPALDLDGRDLTVKLAVPRAEMTMHRFSQFVQKDIRPKKIFVAGLLLTTTEEELKQYFSQFGRMVEAYIQKDRTTGNSRGFGFVEFETHEEVESILRSKNHTINGHTIDCKIAIPKGIISGSEQEPWKRDISQDPSKSYVSDPQGISKTTLYSQGFTTTPSGGYNVRTGYTTQNVPHPVLGTNLGTNFGTGLGAGIGIGLGTNLGTGFNNVAGVGAFNRFDGMNGINQLNGLNGMGYGTRLTTGMGGNSVITNGGFIGMGSGFYDNINHVGGGKTTFVSASGLGNSLDHTNLLQCYQPNSSYNPVIVTGTGIVPNMTSNLYQPVITNPQNYALINGIPNEVNDNRGIGGMGTIVGSALNNMNNTNSGYGPQIVSSTLNNMNNTDSGYGPEMYQRLSKKSGGYHPYRCNTGDKRNTYDVEKFIR